MANRETNIQNQIRLAVARAGATTFRNSVGQGWTGKTADQGPGYITLASPRPLIAGLCVGSSDVIGWKSVVVTPEWAEKMIGQTVAVFVALEIKTPVGRASDEQRRFVAAVQKAGGIAGFPTSPEEALDLLK